MHGIVCTKENRTGPDLPRGGHDCEVDLLGEDGGGEGDVDCGAEPRVGEEDGAGVEDEGGEATEAPEGDEQVHRRLASPRVPAVNFNHEFTI